MLVCLVGVLTVTSALLRALAPDPLSPQASSSLFAIEAPESLDVLFTTPSVPVPQGRWHYIYIHHSATMSGSAQTLAAESGTGLADHFVIGNGDGCADGEIQIGQRWTQQTAPGLTAGADYIYPDCISICLIGDYNQTRPTPTQQRRLVQLVGALQDRLHVPGNRVFLNSRNQSAAGIGRFFPATDFQNQLLP